MIGQYLLYPTSNVLHEQVCYLYEVYDNELVDIYYSNNMVDYKWEDWNLGISLEKGREYWDIMVLEGHKRIK